MTATEVADLSIDGVGQIPIRDLLHQSGEETDRGHQYQEGIDPGPPSQEEIDRPRQVEDEIVLTSRQDEGQLHQR